MQPLTQIDTYSTPVTTPSPLSSDAIEYIAQHLFGRDIDNLIDACAFSPSTQTITASGRTWYVPPSFALFRKAKQSFLSGTLSTLPDTCLRECYQKSLQAWWQPSIPEELRQLLLMVDVPHFDWGELHVQDAQFSYLTQIITTLPLTKEFLLQNCALKLAMHAFWSFVTGQNTSSWLYSKSPLRQPFVNLFTKSLPDYPKECLTEWLQTICENYRHNKPTFSFHAPLSAYFFAQKLSTVYLQTNFRQTDCHFVHYALGNAIKLESLTLEYKAPNYIHNQSKLLITQTELTYQLPKLPKLRYLKLPQFVHYYNLIYENPKRFPLLQTVEFFSPITTHQFVQWLQDRDWVAPMVATLHANYLAQLHFLFNHSVLCPHYRKIFSSLEQATIQTIRQLWESKRALVSHFHWKPQRLSIAEQKSVLLQTFGQYKNLQNLTLYLNAFAKPELLQAMVFPKLQQLTILHATPRRLPEIIICFPTIQTLQLHYQFQNPKLEDYELDFSRFLLQTIAPLPQLRHLILAGHIHPIVHESTSPMPQVETIYMLDLVNVTWINRATDNITLAATAEQLKSRLQQGLPNLHHCLEAFSMRCE